MNPLYLIDFYKVGHVSQYPEDTTQVWSNFTPRGSRVPGQKTVVHFGLQYFIKEILHEWSREFFNGYLPDILTDYREVIGKTLGVQNPRTDHIESLWRRGYLPLTIWAVPEGDSVPLRCPMLVITNETPDTYWLPNYLETILSNILWKPCTSATTAQMYRKIFMKYAKEAGETDFGFVDWQGHDFSFRGMSGREDAILSGMGHLLSFSGTDTLPAIFAAAKYYRADFTTGGSVPATEHSVMCAGGKESELETFRRLLTQVYPEGILSIVSDTWDLWEVLTDYIPKLRETILARKGKLVIRPDSGDPVKIVCGDAQAPRGTPAFHGAMRLLAVALGITDRKINNGGLIYGDAISLERADRILAGIVRNMALSPYNIVFGIGSYTYEYVTRDTFGFAMKATAVRRGGKIYDIFKKPVTDSGEKNSCCGIPVVYKRPTGEYYAVEGRQPEELDSCAFRKVYSGGSLLIDEDFETIRKRVRA